MSISENEMEQLKKLVDATFVNCNPPEAKNKKDVLMCMSSVFTDIRLISKE